MTTPASGDTFVSTLYELLAAVEIYAVDTQDFYETSRLMLELKPGGSSLFIPKGRPGDKGEQGKQGPPYILRGTVANEAALPTSNRQLGDAWLLTTPAGSAAFWNGSAWIIVANFKGIKGDTGPRPAFQIGSVQRADSDTQNPEVSVRDDGTGAGYVLDFVLPTRQGSKGDKGDTGASGPFLTASDVVVPSNVGAQFVPVYDPSTSKMVLQYRPRWVGPYRFIAGSFTAATPVSGGNGTFFQTAQIDFAAVPFAYQLDIIGALEVRATSFNADALIDIEVHLGSPTGPIIAFGSGTNSTAWHPVNFVPSGPATPGGPPADLIAANTVGRIYVIARRREGNGAWAIRTDRARLRALQIPVL